MTRNIKSTSIHLSGLQEPVEIRIDRWGIPHIYAASRSDVFFAQGFHAARDRLWQMDLWRRRGLGLLSEVLGPDYAEQDRAARLFLYRGDLHKEWQAYGPDTQEVVSSFVKGINAYVRLTEENPQQLPIEFEILGYKPSLWHPEDIVSIRSHGLTRNLKSEVARAITLRKYGTEAEAVRQKLEPDWQIMIPAGLDLDDISEEILKDYNLATQAVCFNQERNSQMMNENYSGSNNWVIGPRKSKTGRPILANDPHRSLTMPSLRYIVHLSTPDLDVIGGGEPVIPGVSIGHNGKAAFGLTIFKVDQEDLYVYETHAEDPSKYLYKGKWESFETVTEEIKIKGGRSRFVTLIFTRHGPVIYQDKKRNKAFAVKAAWLEPGMVPYLGSMSYMSVNSWDGFKESVKKWGAPSENLVYADTDGNIGWKAAGIVPVRSNWDGLLPVPGDGTYEWDGFMDQQMLPSEYNPERGWIATANEMNVPADFPFDKYKLGFEWDPPYRYERIAEVLTATEKVGIADSVALQSDFVSIPARRMIRLLQNLQSDDAKVNEGLQLLNQWDGCLAVDSAAAALFEVWYPYHLGKAVTEKLFSKEAARDIVYGDRAVILAIMENPDHRLGKSPEIVRNQMLISSLKQALEHVEQLLGPNREQWKWGALHHAFFQHPLSHLVDESTRKKLDVGPFPRGGNADTVGLTGYENEIFRQEDGATFSVVLDVGQWDNSVAINGPGQSGNPASQHYDSMAQAWANHEAVPLLYSREKIEAETKECIFLIPDVEEACQ